MALFRNKFQIFGMNSFKNNFQYGEILETRQNSCAQIAKRDLKYFWNKKQKSEPISKSEYNSIRPLDNPCIHSSKYCEDLKKKKKEKICKPHESFWDYLFGEPKLKSHPNDCSNRKSEYKCDKKLNEEADPRLTDPRYTKKDIHLFSEHKRQLSNICTEREPQPKPPPPYKIPTAVLSTRIATAIGGHTCVHIPLPSKGDNCKIKCTEPEPFWIPYMEFRPRERLRNPFTCESGRKVEDVVRPINKNFYPTGMPSFSTKNIEPDAEKPKKFSPCPSSSEDESFANTCKGRKKLSRAERLKILTSGREGVYKPIN